VLKGDHRSLAKAISIIEGGGPDRRRLIQEIYPRTGKAFTIGITGPTGTGKSTLVDKTIEEYRKRGRRVGVLAIDPSSPFTGGALLGDRLRMRERSTFAAWRPEVMLGVWLEQQGILFEFLTRPGWTW